MVRCACQVEPSEFGVGVKASGPFKLPHRYLDTYREIYALH